MASTGNEYEPFMVLPRYLSQNPPIVDETSTATSQLQTQTVQECLPLLNAANNPSSNPFDFDEYGLPYLQRQEHIGFVHDGLGQLPASFVGLDASRPWLFYWSLLSLYLLGQDLQPLRPGLIKTLRPLQNAGGGFGGGQGHLSHLAPTYAVILALAMVGGEEAYSLIDRNAMWRWLGQLKQPDGGFRVCEDGEEDVRGAYCALVSISLLNLPWNLPHEAPAYSAGYRDFRDGLGEHLSRCQTHEGGISASPSNEAHGAYAFCALACLCILGPPQEILTKYLNITSLTRWLTARQYALEGGFAGRTNKVVDGCYSHWIGGCWPLLEAALRGPETNTGTAPSELPKRIFSNERLTRYILSCCQAPTGGLRDKPSKRPDAYHTCYNLAGLSMANYQHSYSVRDIHDVNFQRSIWHMHRDKSFGKFSDADGEDEDKIAAINPVYVIPYHAVADMQHWFLLDDLFFER